jgi:hypothetical protein
MDVLTLSGRTDRGEMLGNRMSAYSVALGGGSVFYWDGFWDNDENQHPYQMRAIFEGTDGVLTVWDNRGRPVPATRFYHRWQPDGIEAAYLLPRRVVVKERKGVADDVFVSRLTLTTPARRGEFFYLGHEDRLRPHTQARLLPGGILHLFTTRGQLQGVHRLLALGPGRVEARVTRTGVRVRVPVRVPSNTGRAPAPVAVRFVVAMGMDLKETLGRLRRALRDPEGALRKRTEDWRRYFDRHVPAFASSNPLMDKFYYFSYYVAKGNLYDFGGEGSFTEPYTCPSKMRLLPQWFWDLAFHAVHEKWTHGMPFPKSCIRNCLNAQKPDGHLIFMHYKRGDGDFLDHLGYHGRIQPFIMPLAVWDLYLKDGDRSFLRECLPRLRAFDQWMRRERDPRGEWLVNLTIPGESGWDNSKRYIPEGRPLTPETCGMAALPIQPVDFNTYVYLGRWLIRRMARELGDRVVEQEYDEAVRRTAAAIRGMFHPRLGMYADKFTGEDRLSPIKSAGGLIPLLAGLATRDQAGSVTRHLLNPKEFWSRYPVPSLSMDDPDFTCVDGYQSYWNGRTWANVNWLILEGLVRTGQLDAAARLLERTLELGVCYGEPYMKESYHPLAPVFYDINQSIINYGWTGVITDALLRRALGLQPNVPAGEVILNPLMPAAWEHAAIRGVRLGRHEVDVAVRRIGPRRFAAELSHRGPGGLRVRPGPGRTLAVRNRTIRFETGPWRAPHWLDL